MAYNFRWTCSYMNSAYYDVIGDGQTYEIELRRGVCAYERSIYNGTEAEWQRDIVPLIGAIKRVGGYRVPDAVVDAFNAWRAAEHLMERRKLDAHPEKYGVIDWDNDPLFPTPKPVRAAFSVTTPIEGARPGIDFPAYVWHGWMFPGANTLAHLATQE
jgi:hypothetical protein